ncbi:peptidase M20 [Paraglaciecola sp. T6c]|uniref:M20/M25/M40 family metallo-hydrolase n=1 Tax=Pseudoalteromonas atlantica (strain T6c / ATCC BAA-1087) TaxID=3042615 RepID=UPI00005C70F3|nr:M20/M25/M40 family metallo-hydrolase [Paraglaciecola sp. T6c]ABG39823.1 peptidase M20 [Paraglaciecola sp. T6c]
MLKKSSVLLMCAGLFCQPALASRLVENALVEQTSQELASAKALLLKTVNINSGTMNFAGVKEVGDIMRKEYDALGFDTQWVDGSEFNRAGHLVATYESPTHPSGQKLLLIGHLDTVFAKDDDFQQAKEIDEQHIAGPGISDMKGGNVIMLTAIKALKAKGMLDRLNIKVVLTGDEESSGRPLSQSKKALIDAAIWADVALGFEDADGDIRTAVTARRGASTWQVTTSGNAAHSSQIFTDKVGDGAIFEMARILQEFRLQLTDLPLLSFNPGVIAGGTRVTTSKGGDEVVAFGKTNVVAKDASVKGGLRAASQEQIEQAKAIMSQVVEQHLAQTDATFTFDEGYPPMKETKGNKSLLAQYSQVSVDLGYGPVTAVNPRNAGAADISFTAGHVKMAIDGLGLMGEGGHTKDEVADMRTFKQNIEKTAVLMYRLSNP